MRAAIGFVGILAILAFSLTACGTECGEGTRESDGECVMSVADACGQACGTWSGDPRTNCKNACVTLTGGMEPGACQGCLINSFSAWDRSDLDTEQAQCNQNFCD